MGKGPTIRQAVWIGRLEQLEARHLMSANPAGDFLGGAIEHHEAIGDPPALEHQQQSRGDFWIDPIDESALSTSLRGIEGALAVAHGQTGLDTVRANYGFQGRG